MATLGNEIYQKFGDVKMTATEIDGHGTYYIQILEFDELFMDKIGKLSDVQEYGKMAFTRNYILNEDGMIGAAKRASEMNGL